MDEIASVVKVERSEGEEGGVVGVHIVAEDSGNYTQYNFVLNGKSAERVNFVPILRK